MPSHSQAGADDVSRREPSRQSLLALDWLNVFLADVRDGVGPFLAIYLSATLHWDAAGIGVALSVATIASLIVQTPAGWLVDRLSAKRLLVALAAGLVGAGCLLTVAAPTTPVILSSQVIIGIAGAIFPPVTSAITLGLVGPRGMSRRVGRNESFNHAGNVVTALLAGLAGSVIGPWAIFLLVAAMASGSIVAVLAIRPNEIDHALARGDSGPAEPHPASAATEPTSLRKLARDSRLLIFASTTVLFHFANAAMLPLVGQKLAQRTPDASLAMAACIIIAQLVMIPVALLAGRAAVTWGRRPVFLIALAVLPIRGVLYTFGDAPAYLVAVQALDGIGAGIFGVLVVLIVSDLTAGTGRFNFTQGALATAIGLGASLSNLLTGFIVHQTGYNPAFLTLAGIALAALALFAILMPETRPAPVAAAA